ncbi:MAG: outer membrane lipoprotein LolB [Acidithiobacillus sp.]|nr:outer membrane lipoprotein LolB [Acidithiobacillus sp.]
MTRFSLFFGTFLALFLAGCASVPPPPASLGPLPIAQRQEVLAAVSHWVAQGQASVRSQQGAQSFAFRWQQGPKEQHLRISGPLGTTLAELSEDRGQALLVEANGHRATAPDMGTLLERVLGVTLPVAELPRWLLGIPMTTQVTQYDHSGLPVQAQWQDWQLHYLRYQSIGSLELPALLEARGPQGLQLRIAIESWRLGQ